MSKTERITGDLTIDPTGNFKVSAPIVAQSLTTTQRNNLTGVNGMIIYKIVRSALQVVFLKVF